MIDRDLQRGIRAGLPLVPALFALAISFGILARPLMGALAPIVMSAVVFAGGAQFAALSVLTAGGGVAAAFAAGLLMNARFLPMGLAAARSFPGGPLRRALQGQAIVDASWAFASRGDGSFDRGVLLGASIPQWAAWTSGTAVGVFAGSVLSHPEALGLDAIFPAFYLALLIGELRTRRAWASALGGGAITLLLIPLAPAGLPVVAASLAALLGLRRRF